MNVFPSVRDARTGDRLRADIRVNRRGPTPLPYYVLSPESHLTRGERCVSFPFSTFEPAVLGQLLELKPADVLPPSEQGLKVSEVAGRLAELEARRSRLRAALVEGEENESALPVLQELDRRCKAAAADLAAAQQESASPVAEQWGTLRGLAAAVATDIDARLRVRAALQRLVERIDVLVVPFGGGRMAAVQMRFVGLPLVRSFLIKHHNSNHAPGGGMTPARWSVSSLADHAPALDLRDTAQAAALEVALRAALKASAG